MSHVAVWRPECTHLRRNEGIFTGQYDVDEEFATLVRRANGALDLGLPMLHVRLIDQADCEARSIWVLAAVLQLLRARVGVRRCTAVAGIRGAARTFFTRLRSMEPDPAMRASSRARPGAVRRPESDTAHCSGRPKKGNSTACASDDR